MCPLRIRLLFWRLRLSRVCPRAKRSAPTHPRRRIASNTRSVPNVLVERSADLPRYSFYLCQLLYSVTCLFRTSLRYFFTVKVPHEDGALSWRTPQDSLFFAGRAIVRLLVPCPLVRFLGFQTRGNGVFFRLSFFLTLRGVFAPRPLFFSVFLL